MNSSFDVAAGTIASGGMDGKSACSSTDSLGSSRFAGGFDERGRSSLGSTIGGRSRPPWAAPGSGERSLISRITASSSEDGASSSSRSDGGGPSSDGTGERSPHARRHRLRRRGRGRGPLQRLGGRRRRDHRWPRCRARARVRRQASPRWDRAGEDGERRVDRGGQEVGPVGRFDRADRAAGRQIGEEILDEIRRRLAGEQQRARRRAARQALEDRARRVRRRPQVLLEHGSDRADALDFHRVRARGRRERPARRREGSRQELEERARELPADRLGARRHDEPTRSDRRGASRARARRSGSCRRSPSASPCAALRRGSRPRRGTSRRARPRARPCEWRRRARAGAAATARRAARALRRRRAARISMRARGRSTSRTRARMARESLSLRMYAAALAPSSRTRCKRSSFHESRITGVSRSATSRRKARHSAKPSSPGIRMSLTTSSGWTRNARSSAVAPSSASCTSQPAVRSRSEMNQVTPGSSSATTTRRPLRRTSAAAPRPRPADPVRLRAAPDAATARARWPLRARPRRSGSRPSCAETRSPARARWRPRARRAPRCPRRAGPGASAPCGSTLSTRAPLNSCERRSASCSSVGSPRVIRTVRPSRGVEDLVASVADHVGADGPRRASSRRRAR